MDLEDAVHPDLVGGRSLGGEAAVEDDSLAVPSPLIVTGAVMSMSPIAAVSSLTCGISSS